MQRSKQVNILFALQKSAQFSHPGDNPGIGGTEFMAVSLAATLAEQFPDLRVVLSPVSPFSLSIEKTPRNLTLMPLAEITNEHIERVPTIVTFGLFRKFHEILNKSNVHVWSHNLWDSTEKSIQESRAIGSLVVVSNIQLAIARLAIPTVPVGVIQNPIDLSRVPFFSRAHSDEVEVGVLGVKGLDAFTDIWLEACSTCKARPNLHIIGGLGLSYQKPPVVYEASFKDARDRLVKALGEKVKFHGVLGAASKWEALKRCSYGIANPYGHTECFPTSIVEVLGTGAPVLSLPRWGNGELLDPSFPYYCRSRSRLVHALTSLLSKPEPIAPSIRTGVREYIARRIAPPALVAQKWAALFEEGQCRMPSLSWAMGTVMRREPASIGKIGLSALQRLVT
jgi:hypothetical protein